MWEWFTWLETLELLLNLENQFHGVLKHIVQVLPFYVI